MLLFCLSWWYPFFFMVSKTPLKKGSSSSLNPALNSCKIVTLAGSRLLMSSFNYSWICLKILQSLKDKLLILSMWSCCFFLKTLSSMPSDLRRIIVCLLSVPALYLFQSRMSRYFLADSWVHSYFNILFLRWIVLFGRRGSTTKRPLAPLYLIWRMLRSLIESLRLIF